MSKNSNLFLSIGKPIKDEYGRTVGKIASFALTPSGKFDSVFIEFSNGQFSSVYNDITAKEGLIILIFHGTDYTLKWIREKLKPLHDLALSPHGFQLSP